jgi:hypothetical protein
VGMGKMVALLHIEPLLIFSGILFFANRRVPFEFPSYEGKMSRRRSPGKHPQP